MRQDNTLHTILIKLSFSSIGQDKSKLQKQISKILNCNGNLIVKEIKRTTFKMYGKFPRNTVCLGAGMPRLV